MNILFVVVCRSFWSTFVGIHHFIIGQKARVGAGKYPYHVAKKLVKSQEVFVVMIITCQLTFLFAYSANHIFTII